MNASKIELYLNRARLDSDYDVSFIAEQSLAENVLHDAQQFVDRAEQYLRQVGAI